MKKDFILRVASYNIRHGGDVDSDMGVIARDITDRGIDIAGLQEIDRLTSRVKGLDLLQMLSEASGYPYFSFACATKYAGGEYGTAILSRYPILRSETMSLDSGKYEPRRVGHAVIKAGDLEIDFFNTHLSYEDGEIRSRQFESLAEIVSDSKTHIITGDFNTGDPLHFAPLFSSSRAVNDSKYATFPEDGGKIDNIIISGFWKIRDAGMGPAMHSDHRMLWAELIAREAIPDAGDFTRKSAAVDPTR